MEYGEGKLHATKFMECGTLPAAPANTMKSSSRKRRPIGSIWRGPRQRSHAGLNKGEASNALRRAMFFHRQGEIRDRTFENQSFRASGMSLITAAIVHWNTVSLDLAG